ncbi:MAG: FKBP-type peptidyl-prolyl cis-trans isomerase [Bacteroidales bacterium]|nr:FKBP-type peptidyl-prolyl cis-trans isomerase [Bacteroidales bacterium]
MKAYKKFTRPLLAAFVIVIALASCIKSDSEEYQKQHDRDFEALKMEFGFTEDDFISEGVYLKVDYDGDTATAIYPTDEDFIMADVVGHRIDIGIFEVTNRDIAEENEVDRSDYIYGPIRIWVVSTPVGFNIAIKKVPQGAHATMLLSHEMAYGGYIPIVYEVDIYNIKDDLEQYNQYQINAALDSLDMDPVLDSVPGFSNAYSIIEVPGTVSDSAEIDDEVTISLHGYYVECDTTFIQSFPGREFFPFNNSDTLITYFIGDERFPLSSILTEIVPQMKLNEVRHIIIGSEHGYGTSGVIHPYDGFYIIPPDMPLHYKVQYLGKE